MLGLLRHSRSCYVLSPKTINVARLLSTAGPSTQQQPRTQATPPPLNPRSRKHKLDIRPIKVELASEPPANKADNHESKPTPDKSKPNPIEIAKEDLQSATAHGILVPPPANASWAGKLLHQGKELFKFYWNGLKLIYSNRKMVKEIEQRVQAGGAPMTRWETVFVKTNKQDLVKLIPFVLILLILEEALPLFVLYAPFLLPSTCLLVSQRNRIITKRATKQSTLISSSLETLARVANSQESNSKLICSLLYLSTFGPASMQRRRLTSHFQEIRSDDELLLQEASGKPLGIASNLSHDELVQALSDRGFMTTDVTPEYARRSFGWYFSQESRKGDLDHRISLVAKSALQSRQLQPQPQQEKPQ